MRRFLGITLGAAAFVGLYACGRTLADLAPFPIAKNGTCPDWFRPYDDWCVSIACNPMTQDCNPGAKCSVVDIAEQNETACVPTTGSQGNAEECEWEGGTDAAAALGSLNDCARGYHCLSGPDGNLCLPYCTDDSTCDNDMACAHFADTTTAGSSAYSSDTGMAAPTSSDLGVGEFSGEVGICKFECTPLADECDDGESCRFYGKTEYGTGAILASCGSTGTGGDGDSCVDNLSADCRADFTCVAVEEGSVCRELCDSRSNPCGSGYTCNDMTNQTRYNVGVCVPE